MGFSRDPETNVRFPPLADMPAGKADLESGRAANDPTRTFTRSELSDCFAPFDDIYGTTGSAK